MSLRVESVAEQRERLRVARERGVPATLAAFVRLSGPGWMQAAMTLGAGSLAASLYLGVLGGTELLWVQPLSMILGIIMLAAISYVTLSTPETPLAAMNRHINPILGWTWALAVLGANAIWIMPQFALTTEVLQENLLPSLFAGRTAGAEQISRVVISLAIFGIALSSAWLYGAGGPGIKLYDRLIKAIVGVIVVSFLLVTVTLSLRGVIDWGAVAAGFLPDIALVKQPVPGFADKLSAIVDPEVRTYWSGVLVGEQRAVMLAAASAAVGINMTYQLAYSLRARGWDRDFRSLAIFDLWTGLLIPFSLVVGCITIASATQFHGKAAPGLVDEQGAIVARVDHPKLHEFQSLLDRRGEQISTSVATIEPAERLLAASLVRRSAGDLASALTPLLGRTLAQFVFGIGAIGMTLSSISLMMLISGWVICEMFGRPQTGRLFYVGTLFCTVGLFWPLLWGVNDVKFWLAIAASVSAYILLPIAFWAFFFMMNSRSLLGDAVPTGARRWLWNGAMLAAGSVMTAASLFVMGTSVGSWGWISLAAFFVIGAFAHLRRRGAVPSE